jgi:hypothetical protein
VSHIEITVAKEEDERRGERTLASAIAHEIYEYADERVGHAEGVPKEELMLACYNKLGELLAQWAKKLDKLEKISEEPKWLKEFVNRKEKSEGRQMVQYDSVSLGFPVDNLFFAREKGGESNFSDDLLLVSEPTSMMMEDFRDLVTFCETNGLDFYADGFNTKLPGGTFRIALYVPKLTARTRLELREKTLRALKLFDEIKTKDGIKRKDFVEALQKTGEFDELLANKVVDILDASGQIPQSVFEIANLDRRIAAASLQER